MFKLRSKTLLVAALVAGLSTSAFADPFSFIATDTPVSGPDEVPISSSIILGGAGTGTINDLDVRVNVSTVWPGDVTMTLTHVDTGTAATLSANNGGFGGPGFVDTLFDDEAGSSIASGSSPFAGSFIPDTPLSVFDGEHLFGTWTLSVVDRLDDGGDTHSINSFQMTGSFTPAPIPEPGTFALFGIGALGLVGVVRRRKQAAKKTATA